MKVHVLTSGRLFAVVSMSEVLRVFYDRDSGHSNDHSIGTPIQSAQTQNAMVDMMKRAGRVLLSTDHHHWAC